VVVTSAGTGDGDRKGEGDLGVLEEDPSPS